MADVTEADWILVGHSHFDHLYGAERIARRTGAKVVGSYESIRIMAECGVPKDQLVPVSGGERIQLDPTVSVRVLPGLHSCTWASNPMPSADEVCLGDLGLSWQQRVGRLRELGQQLLASGDEVRAHLVESAQGDRGDGGALVYVIETPDGSVLFQDTAGCWTALFERESPTVAILAGAGRGHRDGEPAQGSTADFVAEQAVLLHQPERLVLCHPRRLVAGVLPADRHHPDPPGTGRPCSAQRARRAGLPEQLPAAHRELTRVGAVVRRR
ncbi:MAG: hypothetical protein QOI50_1853 [Pseudonocardiales bacterium]|nr:hypothetical protein [Pseudonocardiales bacterium]